MKRPIPASSYRFMIHFLWFYIAASCSSNGPKAMLTPDATNQDMRNSDAKLESTSQDAVTENSMDVSVEAELPSQDQNQTQIEDSDPQIPSILGLTPVHTYVVTSKDDSGDDNTAGAGTLRWAILQANTNLGYDRIIFNIPGSGVQTIRAKNDLPIIRGDNSGVWIDGTSGGNRVEIDASLTSDHHTIELQSDNNTVQGLVINNVPDGGAAIAIINGHNNLVIGNFLGTDPTGKFSRSAHVGIYIGPGGDNNIIGGVNGVSLGGGCTGDCNLMSGNRAHGIVIDHAGNNRVLGNFIGVDATGSNILMNGDDGVLIGNAWDNIIGGTKPEERNVIAGNHTINVEIGEVLAVRNLIIGNFIGTDSSGTHSIGGTAVGVEFQGNASGNIIDSNLISGNGGTGILIFKNANNTLIQKNVMGYTVDGVRALKNNGNAIIIQTNNNKILSNKIGNHPYDGVRIKSGVGNTIRMNSLFNNTKLGINVAVDGFTPNDLGDVDTGPNMLQNFPVIKQALTGSGLLTIKGRLSSQAGQSYTIDFYQNPQCDNTYTKNVGEGKQYLGAINVTTNAKGNIGFTTSFPNAPTSGIISSTATDSSGNTSEFSTCMTITAAP